jgi:transposase
MRSVWDAIQYIATTGCQWALLPKDFPPFTMVQYYFYRLRDGGVLDLINEALVAIRPRVKCFTHRLRCAPHLSSAVISSRAPAAYAQAPRPSTGLPSGGGPDPATRGNRDEGSKDI